jgi:hypothetical protein
VSVRARTGARLSLAVLVASCVGAPVDPRVSLGDCPHGLYWAECGGTGEPVLGCESDLGDCRWFQGGVTASGYTVSDCPPTDPCCYGGWPFADFAPTGPTLARARLHMSLLRSGPQARRGPSEVSVVADLVDDTYVGLIRSVSGSFEGVSSGGDVDRVGESIVLTAGSDLFRYELEIVSEGPPDQWSVHLYRFRVFSPQDGPEFASCGGYGDGTELPVTGVLHVNTFDASDLEAFHARLEGRTGMQEFTIEL